MNRRQYLTRAGTGVGTLTLLAGCLGDLTGSETDGEAADRTGERALDRATGKLNEAALALQVNDDAINDPEEIEFDPAKPNGLIDDAREYLGTAAAELADDRQADVDGLETYADILEGLVVVTDAITDETLEDDIDDVAAAIGGDGDLDSAADAVDERTATLATAQTRHDEAAADFEAFEKARFEEVARIDYAELEDGITTLGDVLDSFVTLGDGYESLLDGYEALEQGQTQFDNGEYERAETSFTDAIAAFEMATDTFESDSEPPSGLTTNVETARCQSNELTDAATAFSDAAAAATAGDPATADRRHSDGEQSLEAARNCSQ